MKTVINNTNTLIIKNSKFITLTYKIDNISNIDEILSKVKEDYPKANHYCYAYIIDNIEKCSDDGEPSGTAGNPILNVLQKENINYALCIVIRYFGGIKLGAGGLIRAYSKSAKNCLKTIVITEGYLVKLIFDYNETKYINYILKDIKVVEQTFNEMVEYKIEITIIDYNNIVNKLKEKSVVKIIDKIYL